ncbi:MAG: hypothetical protein PHY02_02030 [Phycisphaerae bacterium]|nr:hypothetical protein [Phycisphaerae bacterium]
MRKGKALFKRVCGIKQPLVLMLLSGIIMSSSGCATVMTGKYQTVPVTSDPPGVKVRADSGESIITPGNFHLIRNQEHTLLAEYSDYEPQQLRLHNKAQGWVWGNILLGGVVGLIVDCSSGASDELVPKEVHFNFINPESTTREAIKNKEKDEKATTNVTGPNETIQNRGKFIGYDVIDGKVIPVYEDAEKK